MDIQSKTKLKKKFFQTVQSLIFFFKSGATQKKTIILAIASIEGYFYKSKSVINILKGKIKDNCCFELQ